MLTDFFKALITQQPIAPKPQEQTLFGMRVILNADLPTHVGYCANQLSNGDVQLIVFDLNTNTLTSTVVPTSRVEEAVVMATSVPVLSDLTTQRVKTKRFTQRNVDATRTLADPPQVWKSTPPPGRVGSSATGWHEGERATSARGL